VFHLAFSDQIVDGSRNFLDRHVRVDAVLVQEIDPIRLESLQASLGDLPDMRGLAIQTRLLAAFELEPELRRDDHLIANGGECFTDEFFVRERTVGFCGVEERHSTVDRCPNEGDHLLLVSRRTVAEAHRHAAKSERRNF
jgi:hypothetical protein